MYYIGIVHCQNIWYFQRITPEVYNLNEVMVENPGGQEGEEDEMMNKTRSPCLRSLYQLHVRMFKPKKVELNTTEKVMELLQPVRYKPTSVAEMAEEWDWAELVITIFHALPPALLTNAIQAGLLLHKGLMYLQQL